VVKPVIPKGGVTTSTTTPGASYTIPGTQTQWQQTLMNLPKRDLEELLEPELFAYHQAQKKQSSDAKMIALLNELGYRS